MSFIERQVPDLNYILCLSEHNKITNIDYCPNLVCLVESILNPDNVYLIFTSKLGFISIVTFESGCMIAKTNIEVMYSYSSKITCITAQVSHDEQKQGKLTKGIYIFIGFEDGTFTMNMFLQNQSKNFVQVFKTKPKLKKKQPVINIKTHNSNLLVACAYKIFIYKNIFQRQQHISPANSPNWMKNDQSSSYQQSQIKIQINSYKLNLQIDKALNSLYVYNEYQGSQCLSLPSLAQTKRIQDSIKVLKIPHKITPMQANIAIIGSSDDTIKFINYGNNVVHKFMGLKNYPTCFEEDEQNGLLWVGCLDGSVACFQYCRTQAANKNKQFVMVEERLKFNQVICQNGIKKIIVHKNLFVLFDANHNIELYDIIFNPTTERQ